MDIRFVILIAAGLVPLVSPAFAGLALTPVDTAFTLSGKIEFGFPESADGSRVNPPECSVVIDGMTSAGTNKNSAGELASVSTSTPKCDTLRFFNLP